MAETPGPAPAGRSPFMRYLCPISDCEWHHDEPDRPSQPWPWKGSIEDSIFAGLMDRAQAVDRTIGDHLATHSVLEWFTEVRKQQVRAERAEAALAELRETLATQLADLSESRVRNAHTTGPLAVVDRIQADTYRTAAWLIRNPDQSSGKAPACAAGAHCRSCGGTDRVLGDPPLCSNCAGYGPVTPFSPVAIGPRTALERAAAAQGVRPVRCGAECGEGHTYEPGSCEAAIDPDEAIARNHADAMRDWGLDEQGEREGGSDG